MNREYTCKLCGGMFSEWRDKIDPQNPQCKYCKTPLTLLEATEIMYLFQCEKCNDPVPTAILEKDGDTFRLNAGFERYQTIEKIESSWELKCESCGQTTNYNIKNLPLNPKTPKQTIEELRQKHPTELERLQQRFNQLFKVVQG